MSDKGILIKKEPTPAQLRANGGRLLATMALRLICQEEGYEAYLRTNHWQDVRAMAFRIYGQRCTIGVNCDGPLNVHHRTYKNLGDEQPDDVEVLCETHHEMKHQNERDFVRSQGVQQFWRDDE